MSSAHGHHGHDHDHQHPPLSIKLNVEDVSPVEKRVVVEIPWEEVRERMNHLYHDLRVGVSLKGFRKGKAPRDVLKQYFGKQIEQDLIHELVRESFPSVVEQSGLQPVGEPLVEPEKLVDGSPFKYTARVEVKPKVEPKDYMGLALEKRVIAVKDEDVDRELENLRQSHTELVPIEGRTSTQAGDVVRVDFDGKCGKIPLKGKGQQLLLADSPHLPPELPGLAKALIGQPLDLKAHDVVVEFPPEHRDPELRGKQATMKISIVEAKQKSVPNLDDEFAKDTGEAETLAALKDRLKKKLEERDEARIKEELKGQLVKKLLEGNQVAVAPAMVERQLDVTLHRAKLQLAMSGVDVSRGVDEQKLREELRAKAQDEVRAGLLLEAIGLKESVQVSDADMEKRLAQIASNRGENVAKIKGEYSRDGRIHSVRRGLLEEKTLDLLITAAKISEATGSP
jgi:trigger factor